MSDRVTMPSVAEQMSVLTRGVVDLTTAEELEKKLARSRETGKPLTVKVGFDPTAADIHLGHTVLMTKMAEFQKLGHRLVYVIGDFTAMIGDPTGRSKTRPALGREEILENAHTYTQQAFKILDESRTHTRFNSEWLGELGSDGMIRLAASYTVARMLERRDFKERYESNQPISVHEFLYPLAQAYDSVVLEADVELGGTDQLFNLNVGRDIMPEYGLEPQVVMTMPLLEGTDGVDKMSKSLGNYVGVTEAPEQMFGKVMSISDELLYRWVELLTEEGADGASAYRARAEQGENPRDLKAEFAERIVARFHGAEAGRAAREGFDRVFAQKQLPDEIPQLDLSADGDALWLPALLKEGGLAKSSSEGRRLIKQGGVKLDGEKVASEDTAVPRKGEVLIQVGKRRFLRVRFG